MSRAALDRNSTGTTFDCLPLKISPSHLTEIGSSRIVLLVPIVVGLVVSLGGVALAAVTEPSSLSVLVERPLATAQIAAGIALSAALFLIPASRAVSRAWVRREVVIADGIVEIVRRTPLTHRRRSVPLAEYQGIAHHVRSSLSGVAHEIVLVHSEPSSTVTLMSAERVTQAMLDEAKALLGLPEISARAIYERKVPPQRALHAPAAQSAVA